MTDENEILQMLGRMEGRMGRIEGRMDDISKLANRVAKLELWQAWLKGVWFVLAVGLAFLGGTFLK